MDESISGRIRKIAKQKGIKLEHVYNNIGMSNAGFYKMLRNESFKPEIIQQIADILGVSLEDLLNVKIVTTQASKIVNKNPEMIQLFQMDFENYLHEIDYLQIEHSQLLKKLAEYPAKIEYRLRQYDIQRVSSKKD